MTCSLQNYRIRIGTFNAGRPIYKKTFNNHTKNSKKNLQKTWFIVTLLLSNYCVLALSLPSLLKPHNTAALHEKTAWHLQPGGFTHPYSAHIKCSPTSQIKQLVSHLSLTPFNNESDVWDPGDSFHGTDILLQDFAHNSSFRTYSWISRTDRNKMAHITNGNRGQRGRGITCVYWNKGPSFLCNKQLDIETILETHKPHVLGLGEANVRYDHNLQDVQLPGYTLHLDSSIDNPSLGMARVAVYTHNALRVKRRTDLEDDTIAAIWLECGLPNQQGVLICVGYRQWRLLGQTDSTSASVQEQLNRWSVFLEKWEAALQENKEVVVTLDANLDHLT
jgi:hypothetical protein